MKIMRFLLAFCVVLSMHFSVNAQDSEDIFTIYLVRHAEKELSVSFPVNPPLTECGERRADSLAAFLKQVELDAVYSTNYTRTKNTAKPTAEMQELEVQIYDPRMLKEFAKRLIDQKEDALVVGHSNTTGVLAGLIIDEDIGSFDEKIYNRIYQVVIHNKSRRLHILHTSFNCSKLELLSTK